MKINMSSIKMTGMEIAARPMATTTSVLKSLEDKCSEHQKLVFLFDCSISMSTKISRGFTQSFLWPTELMERLRTEAEAAYIRVEQAMVEFPDIWPLMMADADKPLHDAVDPETGKVVDDEALKSALVAHDLTGRFEIPINWEHHDEMAPSRMDVVKRLAKVECEKRIQKYPKSQLAVVLFSSYPSLRFNDGTAEELWPVLEEVQCGGGTNILAAIKEGIEACRVKPSTVGMHHFILVTDGEDYVDSLESWIPVLKESGVVLDYIHIGDRTGNAVLQQVCKETGGEFVVVCTEKDLERRFVEAVSRRCLPPAK